MGWLNNLGITATNSAITSMLGGAWNTAQSKLANNGRDRNCKFYYNDGAGGSILQVVVRSVTQGAVNALSDLAVNEFNSLLHKKKNEPASSAWIESELKIQNQEADKYGKMQTEDGTIYALDDWGVKCPDALMLGVETDHEIKYVQTYPNYKPTAGDGFRKDTTMTHTVNTKMLVWYDTTALITINSDKNIINTKVQGRDYSRKELVSNGDIRFSVSGHITSGRPDLYPSNEMQKFLKVMQYKGVVRVNNQVLDQFGITHVVITDFSVTPKEGYKAMQQYTFNAIGLQPEVEQEITEDTITILPQPVVSNNDSNASEWVDLFKNQLEALKSMASDAFSQGVALSTGLLDKAIDKI